MVARSYYDNQKNRKVHDLAITDENPISATTGAIVHPQQIMRMFNNCMRDNPSARENLEKVCNILGNKQIKLEDGRTVTRKLVIVEMAKKAAVRSEQRSHYEKQGEAAAARVEREKQRLAHG